MPDTRPGQMSTEEAEKIASGVYRRLHESDDKKSAKQLLLQWWVADGLIVACLAAILFTGVPIMGRVQWVNEAQAQQQLASDQIKQEVNARFDKLETKVDDLSDLVITQVIANLASDICRYNARRIKELDPDERQRLLTQINQMKARYRQFTITDFNMSDC